METKPATNPEGPSTPGSGNFSWSNITKRLITAAIGGTIFFGAYWWSLDAFVGIIYAIFAYILIFEWPRLVWPSRVIMWIPLTLFFIIGPALMLTLPAFLGVEPKSAILYPFLIAWLNDTAAFIVGSLFGRTPIAPRLSPKKTWEGFIGGLASVLLIHLLFVPFEEIQAIWLIIAVILSYAGDISISRFKRRIGIKDAGSILPGHGGLLDRFNSVLLLSYWTIFRLIYLI